MILTIINLILIHTAFLIPFLFFLIPSLFFLPHLILVIPYLILVIPSFLVLILHSLSHFLSYLQPSSLSFLPSSSQPFFLIPFLSFHSHPILILLLPFPLLYFPNLSHPYPPSSFPFIYLEVIVPINFFLLYSSSN